MQMERGRTMRHRRREQHRTGRVSWLRAGVLGANDGIVSTAALLVGVVAGGGDRAALLIAGIAGLAAGASSMAAGEFVSVSSQRDAEEAELREEARELMEEPEAEQAELVAIYMARGLSSRVAHDVAAELHGHGAAKQLEVHAREELGLDERNLARPAEAAVVSALAFSLGAGLPLLAAAVAPGSARSLAIVVVTLASLASLGALGARIGQARPARAAVRVVLGGAAAMVVTWAIGGLTGAVVG